MSQDPAPQITDLRRLFLEDTPLLDVRAPIEFADGAFPTAVNHPLIDDLERHEVGRMYAEQGQDQAIQLGERLVSGATKAARVVAWRSYLDRYPNAVIYCFRGGMRSEISQRWLFEETGIRCPRVRGGYKAMRRFLIEELESNAMRSRPVVIGGRTGVGKTRFLAHCANSIDLEALAHHRGSAFGHYPEPQPSQIDFENALSIALLKQVAHGNQPFAVEDESRNIGSRHIPPAFFERLQAAPLILLEATFDERVETTRDEYVHDGLRSFSRSRDDAAAFQAWADYLRGALERIQRRLGGARYRQVRHLLDQALDTHRRGGGTDAHRAWIAFLLREYYDGMYEYQIERKRDRVVFHGPRDTALDYLETTYGLTVNRPAPAA